MKSGILLLIKSENKLLITTREDFLKSREKKAEKMSAI